MWGIGKAWRFLLLLFCAGSTSCGGGGECEPGTVRWENGSGQVCYSGAGAGVIANPVGEAHWGSRGSVPMVEGTFIFDDGCVGETQDVSFCESRDRATSCTLRRVCSGGTCVHRVERRRSRCPDGQACVMNGAAATCERPRYHRHAFFLMSGGETAVRGGAPLREPRVIEEMHNVYVESDSWWIVIVGGEISLKIGPRLVLEGASRRPRGEFHRLLGGETRVLSDATVETAVADVRAQLPRGQNVDLPADLGPRLRRAMETFLRPAVP